MLLSYLNIYISQDHDISFNAVLFHLYDVSSIDSVNLQTFTTRTIRHNTAMFLHYAQTKIMQSLSPSESSTNEVSKWLEKKKIWQKISEKGLNEGDFHLPPIVMHFLNSSSCTSPSP